MLVERKVGIGRLQWHVRRVVRQIQKERFLFCGRFVYETDGFAGQRIGDVLRLTDFFAVVLQWCDVVVEEFLARLLLTIVDRVESFRQVVVAPAKAVSYTHLTLPTIYSV